jgi:hypothetical protein
MAEMVDLNIRSVQKIEAGKSTYSFTRPALIRIIQILKRHRDEFLRNNHDVAPISIIVTTLATHS